VKEKRQPPPIRRLVVYSLCPPYGGLFSFNNSAKIEISYKEKNNYKSLILRVPLKTALI